MKLKAIEFIKSHKDWLKLLQEKPYNLIIKEDKHYYLLKYDMIESDMSLEIVRDCRGLIIDKKTLEPVALSFRKFSNIQEPIHDDIDWNSAIVQEKVDGSKLLLFWNNYDSKWQLSTSGMLDAYEAQVNDLGTTFGSLFDKAVDGLIENLYTHLNYNYCYTFELVSPESRIVVPYSKTDIYFIGVRDMETLDELDTLDFQISNFVKTPKRYALKTVEDCMKATEQMGYDEEGFVVVDKDFHRVKIKSPAYVAVHSIRQNGQVNRGSILELIDNNKQDDYLSIFPEYKEYFEEIENKRQKYLDGLIDAYNNLRDMYVKDNYSEEQPKLTRKDYALWIMKNYSLYSSFLFKCLDKKDLEITYNDEHICLDYYYNLDAKTKLNFFDKID